MNRKNLLFVFAAILAVSFSSCNSNSIGTDAKVETDADSVALSLGYSIGANLNKQFPDIDANLIAKGISEAFAGNENPLYTTPEEADAAIRAYIASASERKGIENAKVGEAFLAENAKKEGITVTESGLQYEVLVEGDGEKPTAEDKVKVHYHGTTIDGTVFDSSVDRGEPVEFPLNGVIKGWTEGVQLMNVGSKYKFYIPAELAYGERGAGANIGPNSTLIFEVELLEIIK